MAAPPEVTLQDLTGKYVMNKTLSDPTDPILALQGISWLTRTAIGLATVTLSVTQYERDGDVHVDIGQTVTGGINATSEFRTLDWTMRPHQDSVFGSLEGKSRFVKLADLGPAEGAEEREWLAEGWEEDKEALMVQSWVKNESMGWTANQIWGFQIVEGERRYCRKVVVKKGDEKLEARLVYDYVGKPE